MDVSAAVQQNNASIRQALSMMSLQQAMGKDAQTVNKLIEGMEETTAAVKRAAGPDRGNNIDVRV